MVKPVTKKEIRDVILKDRGIDSKLPRLAFDCYSENIVCDNCQSTDAKSFRYNAARGSGTNKALWEWAPNVNRLIARGWVCHECHWHKIVFEYPVIEGSHRENDPQKVEAVELGTSEVISESSGLSEP